MPGGALATLLSAAAAATAVLQPRYLSSVLSHQFHLFNSSRVSEVTLGTFSVRFCGLFVLPCLAVLVPGGALATLLSAAAATAVLVPGGAFGQQQQQQRAAV